MRWIIACVIGEAIGIAIVSLGYATGDRYFPGVAALLILGAGAWEGLSLGTAQALAGRRFGINLVPWVAATTLAALAGYALSLVGQGAFGGDAAPAGEPALWQIIAGGAGLGLFMGLLFGGAQSLVLPAGSSKRGWIVRNAIGWMPAMAAIMVAASLAGADWQLAQVGLLGLASGAVAGAFVGAATRGGLKPEDAQAREKAISAAIPDRFERFIEAQDPVFDRVLLELRAGRKRSHWMWYVFPQLAGLGRSGMSERYAIASVEEARGYLANELLATRLREAVAAVMGHVDETGRPRYSAHQIFGFPDERKFHSSLTLFHLAAPEEELFKRALKAYFGGENDPATMDLV